MIQLTDLSPESQEALREQYIGASQISKVTGFCYNTSQQILRKLPCIQSPGGHFRVRREHFLQWLEDQEQNPQPTPPRFLKQTEARPVRKYTKRMQA